MPSPSAAPPVASATEPQADFYAFGSALSLTERERLELIRRFVQVEVAPRADEFWERAETPRHLLPRFAELGMLGAAIPEVAGYQTSAVYRGWVTLELARADASTATFFGVHSGLAMQSIWLGGSTEQRQRWLPPMARGELLGGFGLTEPGSGSDVSQGLQTTATRTGDGWLLRGQKRWIGNGTIADLVIIWARDTADRQVKGFIVPTSSPGFRAVKIERKQALRAVQNADLTLDGVWVDESLRLQRIDSFADVTLILRVTRAEVAWQALGNGMAAYEAAVRYAASRQQFGRPIASYQLVQQKLATALANITASLAMCTRIAQLADVDALADAQSAMAKGFVSARMRETVALCRELLGGNGIQMEYGVARCFADAEAIYTYEGTHDMNTLIVGRAITGIQAFVS